MNFSSLRTARKLGNFAQIACVASIVMFSAGCTAKDAGTASQSYKGVINLEGVRFGVPEESVKTAILTFVSDPNVAQYPGVSQYLSRVYDKHNGQYCLSYKDGTPINLRVVYQTPITKDEAMAKLKTLLPASVTGEPTIDDSEAKAGKKAEPVERHSYGDTAKAEIIYSDKSATNVKLISVGNTPKALTKAAEGASQADKTAAADDKKAE